MWTLEVKLSLPARFNGGEGGDDDEEGYFDEAEPGAFDEAGEGEGGEEEDPAVTRARIRAQRKAKLSELGTPPTRVTQTTICWSLPPVAELVPVRGCSAHEKIC